MAVNYSPGASGGYPQGYQAPLSTGLVSADQAKQIGAPAGYSYDPVQGRYVPTVGSPADVLQRRATGQDLFNALVTGGGRGMPSGVIGAPFFGTGGGGTIPFPSSASYPPSPSAISAPTGATTAAAIPTVKPPDDSAAQAAIFARAKDQVGQETAGSMTALRSALASRGLLGGGAEVKGTSNILTGGQQELGKTTTANMAAEAQRQADFAKLGYQGAIEQRGQDITTAEGAANRALDVAKTNYTGGITQRGQDINQNEAQYQGDITQRGQDITARGQTIGALGSLIGKLY